MSNVPQYPVPRFSPEEGGGDGFSLEIDGVSFLDYVARTLAYLNSDIVDHERAVAYHADLVALYDRLTAYLDRFPVTEYTPALDYLSDVGDFIVELRLALIHDLQHAPDCPRRQPFNLDPYVCALSDLFRGKTLDTLN